MATLIRLEMSTLLAISKKAPAWDKMMKEEKDAEEKQICDARME